MLQHTVILKEENRMNAHKNARMAPKKGREVMVRAVVGDSETVTAVGKRFGTSRKTVERLRRERYTQDQIAAETGLSRATVSRILKRCGLSLLAHLKAAIAYYKSLGVTVTRVMTDNGPCYCSRTFAKACKKLDIKHIFTKPYTPQTSGKTERFVQTTIREWAYALEYQTSEERKGRFTNLAASL